MHSIHCFADIESLRHCEHCDVLTDVADGKLRGCPATPGHSWMPYCRSVVHAVCSFRSPPPRHLEHCSRCSPSMRIAVFAGWPCCTEACCWGHYRRHWFWPSSCWTTDLPLWVHNRTTTVCSTHRGATWCAAVDLNAIDSLDICQTS